MAALLCAGPHLPGLTPILGTTDTPAVNAGVLCADCGSVYAAVVSAGTHPAGVIPSNDLVVDKLASLRPAGFIPQNPPRPPSWAPAGLPWPYPARPGTTPAPS